MKSRNQSVSSPFADGGKHTMERLKPGLGSAIQVSGSNRRKWTGSSKHFILPNDTEWEWGWRLAAQSSKRMADDCGRSRTPGRARPFCSACRASATPSHNEEARRLGRTEPGIH